MLVSFAFGAVGMFGSCYMRSWQDFDMISLGDRAVVPVLRRVLSASLYPDWLRIVITVTPLYQGVALLRGLDTGVVGPVLSFTRLTVGILGSVGLIGASRRLGRLLLP